MKERPALQHLLTRLRRGDTLVVWKLDRLGRSLKELVALVTGFQDKGIHFVSLQDHLDTTTAQGRLMFNLFASLAEFERDIIRERTKAGLTAARARGRQGGRPKGLSKEALSKAQAAKTLYLQRDKTVAEISQLLGVGRATIYWYLAQLGGAYWRHCHAYLNGWYQSLTKNGTTAKLSDCNKIPADQSHALMSNPPTSSVTDQQLVAQVLGGNTAAFGQLMQRTQGLVTQLVSKMIRHPADRPDVGQDVYVKVFKNLAGFKFQAKFSTWVGQITYNTCLMYLQKKQLVLVDPAEPVPDSAVEEGRRAPPPLIAGTEYDPETVLFGQNLADILSMTIEQLPPLYRTLIALYHQQELSYEEIAQITSLPGGTVKNYLFRARKLLKQHLLATYQRDDL